MAFKPSIIFLMGMLGIGVLANGYADEPAPAGEVGYYFLMPYTTAPLRFMIGERAGTLEEILEKKCPGAKLLSMAPANSGGYHSSSSFVISFTMPAPGCTESR